jgi:hypothetical protein
LAGGVVYYTIDEGVWKSSEHTTELYSKIYKNVAPYVKEVPVEVKLTKKDRGCACDYGTWIVILFKFTLILTTCSLKSNASTPPTNH